MEDVEAFFIAVLEEAFLKCGRILRNQSLEYDENEPLVTPEFCSILEDLASNADNATEEVPKPTEEVFVNATIDTTEDEQFALFVTTLTYVVTAIFVIISILFNVLVMFAQKRKRCCKGCCGGYFGLIFPVNFLEGRRHRLTILSAFVLTTAGILDSFIDKAPWTNPFLKMFYKIIVVLRTTLSCAPILTYYNADTYATLIIGMIYTIFYIAARLYESLDEHKQEFDDDIRPEQIVSLFVTEAIVLVSGIIVLYGYMQRIYRKCRIRNLLCSTTRKYIKLYLQQLLAKKAELTNNDKASATDALLKSNNVKKMDGKPKENKCVTCWKNNVYSSTPGFRYGLSILVSLTVGLTALSFFIAKFLARAIKFRYWILHVVLQNEALKGILSKIPFPNLLQALVKKIFKTTKIATEWKITAYDLVYDQLEVFLTCGCVVIAFVYIVMYYTTLNILKSYKENIQSLNQRKEESNLLKLKTMSNVNLVVSAVQYAGYQVAYLLWGACLQVIVASLILIIICEVIFLPIKYGSWKVVQVICEWIAPIIVTMLLTKGTQWLLVRFCFLQEGGKVLALDNRRGFYIMMYFMFYYNIFMGLFSCLLRIIKATIFGLYYLPRLDRSIFPRTFEHLDGGFKSYTCLMKLEAMQSNVLVTSFANILLKNDPCDKSPGDEDVGVVRSYYKDDYLEEKFDNELKRRRNIARNRWHLAYTLIQNPMLTFERGVQTTEEEDSKENTVHQKELRV